MRIRPGRFLRGGIFLALVLAGCADVNARREALDAKPRPDLASLREMTLAPYRAWTREDPVDCNSATLHGARGSVLMTASLVDPARHGFDAAYQSGQWVLEVADAARDHGCNSVARDLYAKVVTGFPGIGYSGLRLRAAAGIEDLAAERPRLAVGHN